MKDETPVPVLMYHTVGIPDPDWQGQYLTCPHGIFEDQMRWLKKYGFVTVTLSDLYDYIFNEKRLPKKSVILTFDDGYADIWIFAYPIMKKYGFKGTVFVNPEFVDTRDIIRKRLDEVGSASAIEPRDIRGFLSWQEMAEAEMEGVFDIQAHAMTHTWYPTTDRIIDFRHPGDTYIWMTWNGNIERKPFLQLDDEDLIKWGDPVYEHGKSLSSPRFFPNEKIAISIREHVSQHGGREFFDRPDWKETLFNKAEILKRDQDTGRYESEEEYRKRLRTELSESKRIIEEKLEKKVDYMCWPGGSGTETGTLIAKEIGYKMSTTANDMPLSVRTRLSNIPSQKSDRVARIPPGLYWDGRMTADSRPVYDTGLTLVLNLLAYKKIDFAHIWGRLIRKFLKEYHKIMG